MAPLSGSELSRQICGGAGSSAPISDDRPLNMQFALTARYLYQPLIFWEWICAANLISETLDSIVIQCDGMPAIHRPVTEL